MKLTPASQEHAENWLGMSAGRWRSSLRDCFPVQARVRVSEPSAACLRKPKPSIKPRDRKLDLQRQTCRCQVEGVGSCDSVWVLGLGIQSWVATRPTMLYVSGAETGS